MLREVESIGHLDGELPADLKAWPKSSDNHTLHPPRPPRLFWVGEHVTFIILKMLKEISYEKDLKSI